MVRLSKIFGGTHKQPGFTGIAAHSFVELAKDMDEQRWRAALDQAEADLTFRGTFLFRETVLELCDQITRRNLRAEPYRSIEDEILTRMELPMSHPKNSGLAPESRPIIPTPK